GHLEGNKTLRAVGSGLKNVCRDYDYIARMGGDEFVVLLPGASALDIEGRLPQLRQVVAAAGAHVSQGVVVTASIGVAYFPHDGVDAETLLAEADRRMYQEKRATKKSRAAGTISIDSGRDMDSWAASADGSPLIQ